MDKADVNIAAWASRVCRERFPTAEAVVLGGSHASGQASSRSDVDIAIIDNQAGTSYRESRMVEARPVEWFVFTERALPYFFREARRTALPTVLQLLANGQWLQATNKSERWRSRAILFLQAGPAPWSLDELNQARYELTELLEDLEESREREERLVLAQVLSERLIRFYLRSEGGWLGEGKWLWRMLVQHNRTIASRYAAACEELYCHNRKKPLIQLADEMITASGGRWFHGYYAETRQPDE